MDERTNPLKAAALSLEREHPAFLLESKANQLLVRSSTGFAKGGGMVFLTSLLPFLSPFDLPRFSLFFLFSFLSTKLFGSPISASGPQNPTSLGRRSCSDGRFGIGLVVVFRPGTVQDQSMNFDHYRL